MECSIVILAPTDKVWTAILEPSTGWMGGFHFVSTWEVGAPFAISGQLNGQQYEESGTLLAFEKEKRLQYSHWSGLWRVPNTMPNRAVMTMTVVPVDGGTRVELRQELPAVKAISQHAGFFWRTGLMILKNKIAG